MNALLAWMRRCRASAEREAEDDGFEPLAVRSLRDLGLGRSASLCFRVAPGSKRVVAKRREPFDGLQPQRR